MGVYQQTQLVYKGMTVLYNLAAGGQTEQVVYLPSMNKYDVLQKVLVFARKSLVKLSVLSD